MDETRPDDTSFLLDDTLLEDLLGDLATDDALAHSVSSAACDTPVFFPPAEAASSFHAGKVSLGGGSDATILSTDGDGDGDGNSDGTSETASQVSSSDTAPVVPKKPMTNSTRVRMKQELTYLRDKVVDLEKQLATAKHTAAAITCESDKEETDAALITVQSALWERVARHQRVEKQKAERINAELRLLLEDQLKIARSLEKALRKRPSAVLSTGLVDELGLGISSKRLCGTNGLNPQDPLVFARLTERADRSYKEVGAIWRRTGFDTCKAERNESQVCVDPQNRLYLEVTTAKIVPFSTHATDRAVWACISQPKLKFSHGVYHGVNATPNTIHSHSEMSLRVGSEEAHMQMAIVTKRFEEQDRVVYVLEASASGGGSQTLLQNVQIVEKGWVVLEPVRPRTRMVVNEEGSSNEPEAATSIDESAILQVCMRLLPAVSNEVGGGATGALTDLLLTAFRQNLGFLFQTIENMLVEQMITMSVGEGR